MSPGRTCHLQGKPCRRPPNPSVWTMLRPSPQWGRTFTSPSESFQLQMGFSFPFLRANDSRTSLLIMRTRILLYVGLFLNIIANAVNTND